MISETALSVRVQAPVSCVTLSTVVYPGPTTETYTYDNADQLTDLEGV